MPCIVGYCRYTFIIQWCTVFLVFQEKIDALKVLGADVRPVPAVPFDNPDNYNHQVCVCVFRIYLFVCFT